ncbi:tyrosine-type recombinase/integrase [Stenomitos frigidus]|uniref:tyrosine-type recombinase/integrase n=1 Tax=Stenomitos frigidus TaxID=1886765 RepID=UPI0018EFE1A9
MVKKLGAIAGVEGIHPHRFRHTFGTEVTRRGVDPLFRELMGIKSDRVFQLYTEGVFKQVAAEAYLREIGEVAEKRSAQASVRTKDLPLLFLRQ